MLNTYKRICLPLGILSLIGVHQSTFINLFEIIQNREARVYCILVITLGWRKMQFGLSI